MGDCSVGDFLLVFLLLSILHNGLSDGDSDNEVEIHRTYDFSQLYSKSTGNQGDTLIIGSKSDYESVEHVFPGFDHESCAPMKSVDYDANKYGTKIYKLAANSNYLQEVKATDYFSHSSMQALNCEVKKLLQDETRESKRYVKIVNSWSSINDNIREIKYYSGVSVSIGECIQVTETKCMAELLGGQGLVQFKCDFGTGRPANRPIIVPNPVYIDETTREYFPNGNERREYELHLPGDQSSREWEGKRIMRIGKSSKELGLSTEKLKCHEEPEIAKNAASDTRLKTLVQKFKYSSQGDVAELENSYHAGNTRVWKCTDDASGIKVLRVMNNFVFNLNGIENIRTILYIDGIAIFRDDNERKLEIAEVKFLNAQDYTHTIFHGGLEFDGSSEDVHLHPIHVGEPKIQDVNYILNDNEFSKTTFIFSGQFGDYPKVENILEIGEPHPGIKPDEDKEGRRFQMTIRCQPSSLPGGVSDEKIEPEVIFLRRSDGEKVLPSLITNLDSYFENMINKIWRCEGDETLYRVQTRMNSKQSLDIQYIFHQNGVKIYEGYKDRRHLIEITSYFEEKTSEHNKPTFVPVKFEGLVILPSDDLREKFIDDKGNFRNQLHDEILQFSAKSRESGYTYQVETEFNFRIDNRGGEIVTCVKNDDKDTQRTSWMKTKIRVNKKSTSFISIWPLVDRKTEKKHILHDSYEMWSCKNQEFEFYRIVNKMLMKENTRVYYHPDGVEVQRLILLDGQKFIQIKNERFLREREEKREAIEYIGRLQLERQTLPGFEKMLSSPPFNIQVLGKEAEELSPYQPSYIFTLDSMRYAAFLGLGQRSADKDQPPPIVFSDEMDALQTESFNAKSSRIFQLGRFWNKLLIPKKTMKCYVYTTANLRAMGYRTYPEDDKTKYNPRVAEYIDQKLHILTQDEFDKIFTITSVRTWFCTDNTDEFIKVETVFETTTIPSSVRFADGVKVKLENVKNKELLKITETVYVDMMNSNVYKRLQREPEEPEGKKKKEKQDDLMEFVIKSEKKSGWHIHIPFL